MIPEKQITDSKFLSAAGAFQLKGPVFAMTTLGNGRIHKTFKVVSQKDDQKWHWVLQQLNQIVLPDVQAVTNNLIAVTHHLRQKRVEPSGRCKMLTPVPTPNGDYLHQAADGNIWRAFEWIDGIAYDAGDSREIAYEAARAAGRFHADLADYAGPPLATTIADFHHTAKRLVQLEKAVAVDSCQRVRQVPKELAAIEANRHLAWIIPTEELPQRIVHNDPKLNNILFDAHTQKALCLVDFDTVMPGTILHDFGDMVRSMTNSGGEGTSPDEVFFDDEIYGAIEKGYLSVMGNALTIVEKELLPQAGQVLAFELGVRFLTDYLAGDVYFPITQEDDNLNRCRVQLALLNSMLKKMPLS